MNPRRTNRQYVTFYDRDGARRPYTTSYSDEQDRESLKACVRRYTTLTNVRCVPAR